MKAEAIGAHPLLVRSGEETVLETEKADFLEQMKNFRPANVRNTAWQLAGHLVDLGFVCFLPRYCFVCRILLGQVGIRQNGQITLATMVETTKSQSTKNSLRGDRPPCSEDGE